MRVCQIGASSGTLLPARKRPSTNKPESAGDADNDVPGAKRANSGSAMSYMPARKGGKRTERLRRYSHRAMAMLLETDSNVTWWTSETEPQKVCFQGVEHAVVPHFIVHRGSEREAVYISRAHKPTSRTLEFQVAVAVAFAKAGMRFRVERECDLLADPRLSAARTILWHRAWKPSTEMRARTAALASNPPCTLRELQSVLGDQEDSWPMVIALVAHGWVDVDRDNDIGPATPVQACKMGEPC